MKQLNAGQHIQMDEKTLQKQIKVGQTISKINTLMDVAEGMSSSEWDGVQKLIL